MAIAVIAWLTIATFLTLMLVPVMVSTLDDPEDFLRRNLARTRAAPAATEAEPLVNAL